MTFISTRAEQSRIHVGVLEAFDLKGNETSFEAAKKIAYAEVVSGVALEDGDPPSWQVLAAAEAAQNHIIETTGDEIADFDIASLTEALNGSRRLAILVARLCGAMPQEKTPYKQGKTVTWRNAASAPTVAFPHDLFAKFLKDAEFE